MTHRQTLEAEFLLRFASKLQPGEVLEADYLPECVSPERADVFPGFHFGFDRMFVKDCAPQEATDEDLQRRLDRLRDLRGKMAAFARDTATKDDITNRGVIAVDYIAGCIAALIFEEEQKRGELAGKIGDAARGRR